MRGRSDTERPLSTDCGHWPDAASLFLKLTMIPWLTMVEVIVIRAVAAQLLGSPEQADTIYRIGFETALIFACAILLTLYVSGRKRKHW
jgi:hypothetical protein